QFFYRLIEHGTTNMKAKSSYGLSKQDELKILEAIAELKHRSLLETVPTFLGAHAIPEERKNSREEYVRQIIEEMIPRISKDGLASHCDVYCDTGYFSVEEGRPSLTAA